MFSFMLSKKKSKQKPISDMGTLAILPNEMIVHVASFLPTLKDMGKLAETCETMHGIVKNAESPYDLESVNGTTATRKRLTYTEVKKFLAAQQRKESITEWLAVPLYGEKLFNDWRQRYYNVAKLLPLPAMAIDLCRAIGKLESTLNTYSDISKYFPAVAKISNAWDTASLLNKAYVLDIKKLCGKKALDACQAMLWTDLVKNVAWQSNYSIVFFGLKKASAYGMQFARKKFDELENDLQSNKLVRR